MVNFRTFWSAATCPEPYTHLVDAESCEREEALAVIGSRKHYHDDAKVS
jgi:hypothetical protein